MMSKIAFYIGNLARGGAQRVMTNLACYFNEIGYEVVLVTAKWEEGEYTYAEGIKRILSDLSEEEQGSGRLLNIYRRMKKLRCIWKTEKPDLIVSFMGKSNVNAIATTRGLHIPVLVSVRSDPNREYATKITRFLSKTLFGMASGIVLQTEMAVSYFPSWMRKKTVIMPNSLDERFIRPRFEGIRRKEIVSVGAVDQNKNHKLLIEAFAELAKEYQEWTVTIYGDGCERKGLQELAAQRGLADRVFLPGKENATYDKIYDSSIFVLTSYVEGMPNALIEAMALGLAVISTDCPCGGPRMLIQDKRNGLLIPVDDKKALVNALGKLLEEEQLREQLGQNAHKLGEELAPGKVNRMWQEYIENKIAE